MGGEGGRHLGLSVPEPSASCAFSTVWTRKVRNSDGGQGVSERGGGKVEEGGAGDRHGESGERGGHKGGKAWEPRDELGIGSA